MSDVTFKDHFSRQSAAYSRYRPAYPQTLIEWVAALAPDRVLAIDCATGSGQAAVALAELFEQVIAVDGSASQLAQAQPHPRVRYERAMAESLPVADHSVSLIVAAQAIHWFDFDRFNAECRRALKPRGAIAAWTYEVFRGGPAIDAIVDHLYHDTVGPYWPPERSYVEAAYRTLPFPWEETSAPSFQFETDWTLEQTMGYFSSWSAVQRYKDAHDGDDPLPAVEQQLATVWPSSGTARLIWPLHLRAGRTRLI
jgi:ubiquinone/menaquinone biosynthesis C-methylase UbiE